MKRSKNLLIVALLLAFSLSVGAMPQDRSAQAGKSSNRTARRTKPAAKPAPMKPPCKQGDFIFAVDPHATGSFTVPICIAQHSPVVIELPASDPFYAHHPGDEDFVTLDPRSKTTDPLVIRPGDGFFIEPGRVRPSSVVSVQMTSGLVGSFQIYAIEDVASNNNHVIVSYDRAEVVAARRKLNLRADLVAPEVLATLVNNAPVQTSTPQPEPTPQPIQRSITRAADVPEKQDAPFQADSRNVVPVSASATQHTVAPTPVFAAKEVLTSASLPPANDAAQSAPSLPSKQVVSDNLPASTKSDMPALSPAPAESLTSDVSELERVTLEELVRVSNANKSLRFGKPLHGLSLAVSRSRFVIAGYRVEVIAIRNTLTEPVRLVPGQPEIYVETMHDGRPINSPRLSPRFTASTLAEGAMLSPGSTYYFAFAFDEPILGVNDFLRVAVSQTNAADEPVFANLITAAR